MLTHYAGSGLAGLFLVILLVLIFAVIRSVICHFECPHCGNKFKVSIPKYIFTMHMLNRRLVKCPTCGKSEYLPPIIRVSSK